MEQQIISLFTKSQLQQNQQQQLELEKQQHQNLPTRCIRIKQEQIQLKLKESLIIDDLICPVCAHVIWCPVQCANCKLHICLFCIEEWIGKGKKTCPISGCQMYVQEKAHPFFFKQLASLTITCVNKQHGCDVEVNYVAYDKHIDQCLYQKVSCPNAGCQEIILYKDKHHHIQDNCNFQQQTCHWCQGQLLRKDLSEHENKLCELSQVQCKNEGCVQVIFRKDIQNHQIDCQYQLKNCEFCQKAQVLLQLKNHQENCEMRTLACPGCKKQFHHQAIEQHKQICDDIKIECQICHQNFQIAQFNNHQPQDCFKEAIIALNKQNAIMQEHNLQMRQENEALQARVVKLEEQSQKSEKFCQDIVKIQNEINKVQKAMVDVLQKEFIPHIDTKHKTQFTTFDELWEHMCFLKQIYILYMGWHKLHCNTCMDFTQQYFAQLEQHIEKRQFLLKQLQVLCQQK